MDESLARQYETSRRNLLRRFLDVEDASLTDAELLELLLDLPPGDPGQTPLPHRLLTACGSFARVLHADARTLRALDGMDEAMIGKLHLLRAAFRQALRSEIDTAPVIGCWTALMDYCRFTMGHARAEEFHVLLLNHRHALLADVRMQRGTINHTPVYPREVVRLALQHDAAAMILVHNHPSGDPTPSPADVAITQKVINAAATINVAVHDHVIVTAAGHYSFRAMGLLGAPQELAAPPVDGPRDRARRCMLQLSRFRQAMTEKEGEEAAKPLQDVSFLAFMHFLERERLRMENSLSKMIAAGVDEVALGRLRFMEATTQSWDSFVDYGTELHDRMRAAPQVPH